MWVFKLNTDRVNEIIASKNYSSSQLKTVHHKCIAKLSVRPNIFLYLAGENGRAKMVGAKTSFREETQSWDDTQGDTGDDIVQYMEYIQLPEELNTSWDGTNEVARYENINSNKVFSEGIYILYVQRQNIVMKIRNGIRHNLLSYLLKYLIC